jgi:uncharacterized protein (DUF2384 family)
MPENFQPSRLAAEKPEKHARKKRSEGELVAKGKPRLRYPKPAAKERVKLALAGERTSGALAAEASVLDRAVEVIGARSEAMRWMGTPVRALGYATPVSLLATAEGRATVLTVLGGLEHGVM